MKRYKEAKMENCVRCGKELQENNPVCPHCGFRNILEGYSSFNSENVLIFIEGGAFTMGSDSGLETEKPAHQVTVLSYYLNRYTITQKEWHEVMGSNPSEIEGEYFPVENISWYDAIPFRFGRQPVPVIGKVTADILFFNDVTGI